MIKNNIEEIKYTCILCGARYAYKTHNCLMCGWMFDKSQNETPTLNQGKNIINFNTYKCVFYLNEDIILGMEQKYLQGVVKVLYNKNPNYYDNYDIKDVDKLIASKHKRVKYPPYKCKLCGIGNIPDILSICAYCGWEDDGLQNDEPDYFGGANKMSLNQYRQFWKENKDLILKSPNTCLTAINLSKEYYKTHFKAINDSILQREKNERQKLYKQVEELRRKNKID